MSSLANTYRLPDFPYAAIVGTPLRELDRYFNLTLQHAEEQRGYPSRRTTAGLRAYLPQGMGQGAWDWFRLTDELYLSLSEASYNQDVTVNLESQSLIKLRFVLDGTLEFQEPRQRFVPENYLQFQRHSAEHSYRYRIHSTHQHRMVVLHVTEDCFAEMLGEVSQRNWRATEIRRVMEEGLIRPIGSLMRARLESMFQPVYGGALGDLHRHGLCHDLLVEGIRSLLESQGGQAGGAAGGHGWQAAEAREILLENLRDPPGIQELARLVGLNQTQLKQCFKARFGLSILQFVIAERLKLANEMLMHSALPIAEIAWRTGYAHTSNFTTAYRRHFGQTPASIRRSGG